MPSQEMISFARGAPSSDLIPVDAVRTAAEASLREDWETALSYGGGYGHPALRQWLAGRHGHLEPENVMITNGSLEAGAMVFRHLVEPGDRVLVEQPSYDRTLLLLRELGAELVPVPLEDDGVDLPAVEAALEAGPVKLAHIIPNYHNPAGCTLSAPKRERLVALAAERGFTIFEDDPYRELNFDEPPPPTMLSLDETGCVLHASSFSKTVSPGVRMGYLAGSERDIADMSRVANGNYISPNMLAGSIVNELARSGALDHNIAAAREELAARSDAMMSALNEDVPEARFVSPAGGYFLWLELPGDVDTVAALERARSAGVTYVAGPDFMIEGGTSSLRLSFAPVGVDRIEEGIARLASALASSG